MKPTHYIGGTDPNTLYGNAREVFDWFSGLEFSVPVEFWLLDWKGELCVSTSLTPREIASEISNLGVEAFVGSSDTIRFKVPTSHFLNTQWRWIIEKRGWL